MKGNKKCLNRSALEELKTVFDSFDADGNGQLSRDEIADVLTQELGTTDEQLAHYMEHSKCYDVAIPPMIIGDWLRESGFVDVDVTWRRLRWANLVAHKA